MGSGERGDDMIYLFLKVNLAAFTHPQSSTPSSSEPPHRRGRSISFIYPVSIGLLRESKPSISYAGIMTANKTEKASTLMKLISQLERENNNNK